MIDILIQMFGPALAKKLFSSDSDDATSADVIQALRELAEEVQTMRAQIARQRFWLYTLGVFAIFALVLAVAALKPEWFKAFFPAQ